MLHLSISRRAVLLVSVAALLLVPAIAIAQSIFDDVPDTSAHIDGVTFVKNSGVSIGCDTNNNYCPSDPVSRDQMGTFMYRLSGNDPATPPSVHAALADSAVTAETADVAADSSLLAGAGPGAYVTDLNGVACGDGGGCADVAVNTETAVLSLPVDAVADGVTLVSYTVSGSADPTLSGQLHTWLTLNDPTCDFAVFPQDPLPGSWQLAEFAGGVTLAGTAGQSTFPIASGAHTLYLCAVVSGDDPLVVFDGQISSVWSASGSGSTLSGAPDVTEGALSALDG